MNKSQIPNPKSQIPNKSQIPKINCINFLFVIGILVFVILTSGCETMKEYRKGFLGVSTKVLEEGRKEALTKTFNYDYNTCYIKTKEILKQMGAYIYAQDKQKQMVAIYVSEENTTPVGFFFKEVNEGNTQIEISSPSNYAKEFFAEKLFSDLGKTLSIEQELEQRQK